MKEVVGEGNALGIHGSVGHSSVKDPVE